MESEWPEKRMQAVLPFMARMPCSHGEVAFKNGNRLNDSGAPPSRPSSRGHGQPRRPHLAARCCPRPSQNRIKVPWPPAKCRQQRLPEIAGRHDAPRYTAAESPNRREP
jgi:hypothetical protein